MRSHLSKTAREQLRSFPDMSETIQTNIIPAVRYRGADAVLEWLKRAFGCDEKAVYRGEDGAIHHAGAGIVRELKDMPYGSCEYSARDLEGTLWSFGTYDPYAS
jgi:uncharacterized glyoxalase superfamily protein PhnB